MKFKEVVEIYDLAKKIIKSNKLENTKFSYAVEKFYKNNIAQYRTEIIEKLEDINVEHALVDQKTKEILYDTDGGVKSYKYDKNGMIEKIKKSRELFKEYDDKNIELKLYLADEPDGLQEHEIESLEGVITKKRA